MGPWRLVLGSAARAGDAGPAPEDGPRNMAVDEALLESVADGGAPAVRLYRWCPATLSFGRNQPARDLYDEAEASRRGIAFVRRPTGGQAVLHDDELTYALVAPVETIGKPRAAYRRINEALVAGLRELGLEAAVSGDEDDEGGVVGSASGKRWTDACFRRPERGEVVASGRKLVGSAQRTERHTILQHGSILLGGTQAVAEELLKAGPMDPAGTVAELDPGWTTVRDELGSEVDAGALHRAVVSGFGSVFGTRLAASDLTPAESARADALRAKFESDAWTWRR